MTYARVITDECVSCGQCEGMCPVDAIYMDEDHMKIDSVKCAGCGRCQMMCPVGAIIEE